MSADNLKCRYEFLDGDVMKLSKSKGTIIFLITAFLLPLFCVLLILLTPLSQNPAVSLILYGIEDSSPAIGAILAVTILSRNHGEKLSSFLKSKFIDNLSIPLIILGIAAPVFIYSAAKVISFAIGQEATCFIPPSKNMFIILWSLISEELGWRGFLQERVEKKVGAALTPFIIGIIWAMWHYHFFISTPTGAPFYLFLIGCIAESCGYYVITKLSKGNVLPASVAHCAGNFLIVFYLLNPDKNGGDISYYLIYSALTLIYIPLFFIYLKISKRRFDAKPKF